MNARPRVHTKKKRFDSRRASRLRQPPLLVAACLIARRVGRTVDPVSRTVDVVYSLGGSSDGSGENDERFAALRVGGLVDVSLPAGDDWVGVAIPRSALIDLEGRSVVYVQEDGEHFSERLVQKGARAGDQVAIVGGLRPGERIVVKGANLVRLAERSKGGEAHGHIH